MRLHSILAYLPDKYLSVLLLDLYQMLREADFISPSFTLIPGLM
jgi:hypothetical protein